MRALKWACFPSYRPFAENYYLFVAAGETTRKNAPLLFYASLMTSILQLMTTKLWS